MTHRLTANYAKNYCNRTLIVKVIIQNVVTFFWGHSVQCESKKIPPLQPAVFGHFLTNSSEF